MRVLEYNKVQCRKVQHATQHNTTKHEAKQKDNVPVNILVAEGSSNDVTIGAKFMPVILLSDAFMSSPWPEDSYNNKKTRRQS